VGYTHREAPWWVYTHREAPWWVINTLRGTLVGYQHPEVHPDGYIPVRVGYSQVSPKDGLFPGFSQRWVIPGFPERWVIPGFPERLDKTGRINLKTGQNREN